MQSSGGASEPSPLETDMAEQGRKARESAARLGEAGVTRSLTSGDDNEEICDALNGMMPLRCGVSGRQVRWITGLQTGATDLQAPKIVRKNTPFLAFPDLTLPEVRRIPDSWSRHPENLRKGLFSYRPRKTNMSEENTGRMIKYLVHAEAPR